MHQEVIISETLTKPAKIILGEIIKNARREKKLSQLKLSKAIGISVHSICNWERGKKELSSIKLLEVASILNIDLNRLYTEIFNEPSKLQLP